MGPWRTTPPTPDDNEQPNPFKGTPFEQIFAAFGGRWRRAPRHRACAGGMPDLSALLGQMQAMLQPHEGAVNWNLAKDLARRGVAAEPDPSVSERRARPASPTRSSSPTSGSTP